MKKSEELYSSFKAAYHLDRLTDLRNGKLIYPTHIQIDPTNKCNHDCVYCFYHGVNKSIVDSFDRKATLPFETIIKLIDEMVDKNIPALEISGGGDPLVYPKFKDIMDYLNKTNLETSLVTNGGLLTDDIISRLYKFSWIRVSVDGATKETYAKSQGVKEDEFNKVITNIEKLVKELKDTVIGVSFVINPINYKEIYQASKLFKEIGVHNIRLSIAYTDDQTDIFKPFYNEMMDLSKQASQLTDENFRVFDLGSTHMSHLESKKQYSICGYSHFTAAIEADGSVRPCCTMKGLSHSNFGNIKNNSFEEIWFGDTRKKWLDKFDANKCILCWMDGKNEFIEYIISDKKPMHVNYV